MRQQSKIISSLVGAALLGTALVAPVSAEPTYSVTFSNGSVYFQQNQHANNGYGLPYGQYGQPQGGQVNYYPGSQQYPGCPNSEPQYSNQGCDSQNGYDPYQGFQNNQGYQNQGYQTNQTQTVWQPVEPVTQPAAQDTTNTFAFEVLRLTNQERANRGLAPLAHHAALAAAAAGHSQEMLDLGYFSHTSPTPGRSGPQDRVRQAGANPGLVAENIFQASGYDVTQVAQLAVDNWLESPGHRRNMLDPSATHLGVGFVSQNGTVAVTQVFGNRL
jgi:uncharacterized protein YkwD